MVQQDRIGAKGFTHTDFNTGDKVCHGLHHLTPTGADLHAQVVVLRSSGNKTVAEVESVSPGWVKVKLDEVGSWKSVPEQEIYRLIP